MKTVYVVQGEHAVTGVFTTRKKAEAYAEKQKTNALMGGSLWPRVHVEAVLIK